MTEKGKEEREIGLKEDSAVRFFSSSSFDFTRKREKKLFLLLHSRNTLIFPASATFPGRLPPQGASTVTAPSARPRPSRRGNPPRAPSSAALGGLGVRQREQGVDQLGAGLPPLEPQGLAAPPPFPVATTRPRQQPGSIGCRSHCAPCPMGSAVAGARGLPPKAAPPILTNLELARPQPQRRGPQLLLRAPGAGRGGTVEVLLDSGGTRGPAGVGVADDGALGAREVRDGDSQIVGFVFAAAVVFASVGFPLLRLLPSSCSASSSSSSSDLPPPSRSCSTACSLSFPPPARCRSKEPPRRLEQREGLLSLAPPRPVDDPAARRDALFTREIRLAFSRRRCRRIRCLLTHLLLPPRRFARGARTSYLTDWPSCETRNRNSSRLSEGEALPK